MTLILGWDPSVGYSLDSYPQETFLGTSGVSPSRPATQSFLCGWSLDTLALPASV